MGQIVIVNQRGKNRKKCDASLSLIKFFIGSRETLNDPDLLGIYHVRPDDIKYMIESEYS